MSNSANMTVAERLSQRLKESELGTLLAEDDIAEIAGEAIKRAFFEERVAKDGYRTEWLPPIVVELAAETFKVAIAEAIKPIAEALCEDEDFKLLLQRAIIAEIPRVAERFAYGMIQNASTSAQNDLTARLNSTIGAKLGIAV